MHEYRIQAPGYELRHLLITRLGCLLYRGTAWPFSYTREEGARLIRNARAGGYLVTRLEDTQPC